MGQLVPAVAGNTGLIAWLNTLRLLNNRLDPENVAIDHGNLGASKALDAAAAEWHVGALDQNCAVTLLGGAAGQTANINLLVTNLAAWNLTHNTTVKWAGGAAPVLPKVAGTLSYINYLRVNNGPWLGTLVAASYA